LHSFDEFLERKFPQSRRKAHYVMTIHERLPRIRKAELEQVGWTKAIELAKAALRDGQRFDCATWVHRARELPKEQFKHKVQKHLTGKDTEPWETLYLEVYRSQLAVIEQALESAALMMGGDKARGYCLEMFAADFLAGVAQETNSEETLFAALVRLIGMLTPQQRNQLLQHLEPSGVSDRAQAAAAKA